MISKKIQKALAGSSAIRAMFVEGNELAAKVGRENVYDFSLGNPATPAPAALNEAVRDLVDELDPLTLHGYMDNAGYPDVRQAIADNLNKRFGTAFDAHNIIMTVGAAGGLNIIFKTILDPGDEVILTDADGNVFSYEVDTIETVGGTDIEKMEGNIRRLDYPRCMEVLSN